MTDAPDLVRARPARAARWRWDALAAMALFVFGWTSAVSYRHHFVASGGVPRFYQDRFAPAVSLACGQGFRTTRQPEVVEFLTLKVDRFECGRLDRAQLNDRLTTFDRISRYLLGAVAFVWTVRGISWAALDPLFGLLAGSTAALAYGLLRLGAGRAIAAAGTILFAVSPLHLWMVPHLRDYAKAPFLLAAMLIAGFVAARPRPRAQLLAAGAAGGALFGVGLGFRNDILIAALPLAAAFFLARPSDSRAAAARLSAAAAFVLVMAVAGWPILRAYAGGSNTGHVIALGLTEPFSRELRVQPSFYDFGRMYDDSYAYTVVNAFAERAGPRSPGGVMLGTAEYDRAAMRYLGALAATFPADFVVRAYAAVLRVLTLPLTSASEVLPLGAPAWLERLLRLRQRLVDVVGIWFLAASAVAWVLVSLPSPRTGVALLVIVGVFAGGAMLQFQVRHVFHLEILPWWALAFCAQTVVVAARRAWNRRNRGPARERLRPTRAGFMLVAAAAAAVPATLAVARAAQKSSVRNFYEGYLAAPRTPLMVTRESVRQGVLVRPELTEALTATPDRPTRAALLLAEFGGTSCEYLNVNPVVRYGRSYGDRLSRRITVSVPRPPAVTLLFLPVLSFRDAGFVGLEFAAGEDGCLKSLSRVSDRRLPVLLPATLGPGWTLATRFQTFQWERRRDTQAPGWQVLTDPEGLPARWRDVDAAGLIGAGDVETQDSALRRRGQSLLFNGRTADPVLLQTRPTRVNAGSYAVVSGDLASGTLDVALLDAGGRVVRHVTVQEATAFAAVLHVPRAGDYRLRISTARGAELRLLLRRAGFARAGKEG